MANAIFDFASKIVMAIGFVFVLLGAFILTGILENLALGIGVILLMGAAWLSRMAGTLLMDERELRISRKAIMYALVVMLFYCIFAGLIAKRDPGLISVPMALLGAVLSLFITNFITFHILRGMAGAETDERERK